MKDFKVVGVTYTVMFGPETEQETGLLISTGNGATTVIPCTEETALWFMEQTGNEDDSALDAVGDEVPGGVLVSNETELCPQL